MLFCFFALLTLCFLAMRAGKFGPYGRGFYRRGPWGQGQGQGQPPQAGAEGKPGQPHGQGWVGPWGPAPRPEDEALKVLADRLASGDITPDEYLQRVSVLRQQG